ISIRDGNQEDIQSIVPLVNSAFLVELFFIERDRTDMEMVRSLMQKGKFLLAEDATKLVGCVYVELRGDRGYLGMLSVDPNCQGKGVGRLLMAAAENYFLEADCRFSDLMIVNVRTELLSMYRHFGYVETGTAPYENRF